MAGFTWWSSSAYTPTRLAWVAGAHATASAGPVSTPGPAGVLLKCWWSEVLYSAPPLHSEDRLRGCARPAVRPRRTDCATVGSSPHISPNRARRCEPADLSRLRAGRRLAFIASRRPRIPSTTAASGRPSKPTGPARSEFVSGTIRTLTPPSAFPSPSTMGTRPLHLAKSASAAARRRRWRRRAWRWRRPGRFSDRSAARQR